MIVYQTSYHKNQPFSGIVIDITTFYTDLKEVNRIIKRQVAKGK